MTAKLQIFDLTKQPDAAAKVAQWIEEEWGQLPIHAYFNAVHQEIHWPLPLPRTLVALYHQDIVGTVSVLLDDLETRPDFNPWIGCLFVHKDYRRKGIGSRLLKEAEKLACDILEIKKAYLFTENQEHMYEHLGWTKTETDIYKGQNISIMTKEFVK